MKFLGAMVLACLLAALLFPGAERFPAPDPKGTRTPRPTLQITKGAPSEPLHLVYLPVVMRLQQ